VDDRRSRPLPGTERFPAAGLLLTGILSIQFGAAFAATLFDELGPSGTSLLRLATAAVLLWLLWRPSVRGLSGEQWRAAITFGLVLGLMNLSFYEALQRIPLGPVVTIEFAGPLAVAIAFSRKRGDFAIVLLAGLGVLLVTDPWGVGLDRAGLGFAFVAGVCWALYILAAQHASRYFDGSDGVTIAMVVGVAVPLVPGIVQAGSALLDPKLIALGALVGIFSSVVPYSLETEALRRLPARVFSVLLSLEPAVAAIAGLIVLGQRLELLQVAGIAMVVAASVIVTYTHSPPAATAAGEA